MFDIGFSELLVIGVVALVVIGPERLPKVARTAGSLMGRLNRYVSQVKQDVERDMHLDELRQAQKEMQDTAQKYEIMAEETSQAVREGVSQVEHSIAPQPDVATEADGAVQAVSGQTEPEPQQAQMELLLEPESSPAKKDS